MRHQPQGGRVNYWVLIFVAALLCAGIVGYITSGSGRETPQPAPSTQTTSTPSSSPSSPTPTPSASASKTPTPDSIAGSMPVEIFVPRLGMKRTVHQRPCPIVDGKIDPDRSDYTLACVVTGSTLASVLPGTSTPNATMIVGHTWRARPTWKESVNYAAFNALYNWETGTYNVKAGDEVWIRTVASGKRWLVYTITGFSEPSKTVDNNDLWDFADMPAPNTLKLVGCQQPSDYSVHSKNNIVVKAVFARVEG